MKIRLAQNLKCLRKQFNLSLDKLALFSGLSKAFLSQLENKKSRHPSYETVSKLAKVFNANPEVLYHGNIQLAQNLKLDMKFINNSLRKLITIK